MILLADSGSTKTEWRLLIPDHDTKVKLGKGINPHYQSDVEILQSIQHEVKDWEDARLQKIYFYGAGCASSEKKERISKLLCAIFTYVKIKNIVVETDLLAVARSLAGNQKGIIGILGTGSNANFYDGKTFPDYQSSLGFLLGDEGSGADLGCQLVKRFLRKELPLHLYNDFCVTYSLTPRTLIAEVYDKVFPNRYLAGFSFFLSKNIQDQYVQNLLLERFNLFFQKTVIRISEYQNHPFFMSGSIAFHFQSEIRQVAQKHRIHIERIIKQPSQNLDLYHRDELQL